MLIDFVTFPWYSLPLFSVFFVCGWIFFIRHACASFFDPLNLGVNMTLSGSMTIYTILWLEDHLLDWDGSFIPLFTLTILISVRIASARILEFYFSSLERTLTSTRRGNPRLHWLSGIFIFTLAYFLFIQKFGLPMLYENPMNAKTMYSGGDGALRRLLQSSCLFVQFSSLVMFVRYKARLGIAIYLLSAIAISLLIVSKSALIGQLFMLIFVLNVYGERSMNKYIIPLIPLGLIFSFYVIYATLSSVIPNVGMDRILSAFSNRLIAFGDSSYYVLSTERVARAFNDDDVFDLIRANLTPFLASFRLLDWNSVASTGGRIYAQITGYYSGVGPNATPQVEGWLFLGWFGFFYCIVTSISVVIIRRIAMAVLRSGDVYFAFLGGTIYYGITSALSDGAFWGTLGVDFAFSVGICIAIYCIYAVTAILLSRRTRIEKFFVLRGI